MSGPLSATPNSAGRISALRSSDHSLHASHCRAASDCSRQRLACSEGEISGLRLTSSPSESSRTNCTALQRKPYQLQPDILRYNSGIHLFAPLACKKGRVCPTSQTVASLACVAQGPHVHYFSVRNWRIPFGRSVTSTSLQCSMLEWKLKYQNDRQGRVESRTLFRRDVVQAQCVKSRKQARHLYVFNRVRPPAVVQVMPRSGFPRIHGNVWETLCPIMCLERTRRASCH
ncbi:hypothetical protein BKA93DRAFT_611285 [Sparassis latifolia]